MRKVFNTQKVIMEGENVSKKTKLPKWRNQYE